MIIHGVALLSLCYLLGLFAGQLIGASMGIDANVGGVGIAMLLLIIVANTRKASQPFTPATSQGIAFWNAMYIPIVVAMAARQDVYGAIGGGPLALTAGIAAVAVSFYMVPVLSRIGQRYPNRGDSDQ